MAQHKEMILADILKIIEVGISEGRRGGVDHMSERLQVVMSTDLFDFLNLVDVVQPAVCKRQIKQNRTDTSRAALITQKIDQHGRVPAAGA